MTVFIVGVAVGYFVGVIVAILAVNLIKGKK